MSFHIFHIDEVYSNPDGTIQFIEFQGDADGQEFWSGHLLQVTNGVTTNTFNFTHNLSSGSTTNKHVLVATQGYADLAAIAGLPAPDFIVPNFFLFTTGNINVTFPGMLEGTTGTFTPFRDGVQSTLFFPSSVATNSPTNFAGASGVIPLQPFAVGTLTDQFVGAGQSFSYDLSSIPFFNVDGDAITYTALQADNSALPAWLTFNGASRTFSGTPAGGDVTATPLHLKFIATDNDGSDFLPFDLTVISGLVLPGTGLADTLVGGADGDLISGFGGNDSLDGAAGNDTLEGAAGNDTLDGGTGDDSMSGGAGNDTYVVDSTSDSVVESSGQGTDLIQTTVTLPGLAANVDNLTLLGVGNLNATGNGLNNVLTGNDGNNTFNGAGGADTMVGGDGNDTFLVDSTTDQVIESLNEGTDLIITALALSTLAANVENLTLTGGANIAGIGNGLANAITGNTGSNFIAGGAGNDTLDGGAGNDILNGGADNDAFQFSEFSSTDRIVDFNSGGDQIFLDDALFTSLGLGAVAAGQLEVTTSSLVSGTSGDDAGGVDYLKYAIDTGELYYDDNGTTAGGLHLIAILASPGCSEPHPTLDLSTAQDIVVV